MYESTEKIGRYHLAVAGAAGRILPGKDRRIRDRQKTGDGYQNSVGCIRGHLHPHRHRYGDLWLVRAEGRVRSSAGTFG